MSKGRGFETPGHRTIWWLELYKDDGGNDDDDDDDDDEQPGQELICMQWFSRKDARNQTH